MKRFDMNESVRKYEPLKSTVFGRARLLPSRVSVSGFRLSRSFALPFLGHLYITRLILLACVAAVVVAVQGGADRDGCGVAGSGLRQESDLGRDDNRYSRELC